jgi:protein TonB
MLDQLVESRNDIRKNGRSGYLATTAVLVVSLFASGILWSLFAKDLGGNENLELSALIAPVKLPEDAPQPEPVKQIKQEQTQKVENDVPVRQVNMARVDEPFVPDTTSTTQNTVQARPNTAFKIGKDDIDPTGNPSNIGDGERNNSNLVTGIKTKDEKTEPEENTPPPIKKKEDPKPDPKPAGPFRSSTILNGKATSLPVPAYPAAAKAIRASGDVNVQVTIDERGNVISANSVSGHALLKQAAENAARGAKFTPTILNGQPVKVTGIIIYKFAMQ